MKKKNRIKKIAEISRKKENFERLIMERKYTIKELPRYTLEFRNTSGFKTPRFNCYYDNIEKLLIQKLNEEIDQYQKVIDKFDKEIKSLIK